jgi:flagellar protein FliS
MFAAYRNAAANYNTVRVESGVAAARPIDLVVMVYEGAVEAIGRALANLATGDVNAKNTAVSRAIRIIDEGLKAPLDPRGGEITANLADLYDYMVRRLLQGSARNEPAMLEEVRDLLLELKSAWDELAANGK